MPSPKIQLLQSEEEAFSLDSPVRENTSYPLMLSLLKEEKSEVKSSSLNAEIEEVDNTIQTQIDRLTQSHEDEVNKKIEELKQIALDECIVNLLGYETVNKFLGYNIQFMSETPPAKTIAVSRAPKNHYNYSVRKSNHTITSGTFYYDKYIYSLPEATPLMIKTILTQCPILNLTSVSQCSQFHAELIRQFHNRYMLSESGPALKCGLLLGGLIVGGGLGTAIGIGSAAGICACIHGTLASDSMIGCSICCGSLGGLVSVRAALSCIAKTPEQTQILLRINTFEKILLEIISKKVKGSNPAIENQLEQLEAQAVHLRFLRFATSSLLFERNDNPGPIDQCMVDGEPSQCDKERNAFRF